MRKIFYIGILILNIQIGFSQNKFNQKDNTTKMETPIILGLRTTIYKVGDIDKAKDWYSKAFNTKAYFEEPFYVGFNIGGYELGLQPEEKPVAEKAESVVAYWGVEEIDKVYLHLISLGATENEKPFNVGGDLKVASVKDPWGNIIGLIYNPEFKLKE